MEPTRVVYEDLVEDYEGTLLRMLEEIDVPVPENFSVPEPKMKRQADELSEDWVRLYNEAQAARQRTYAGRL